MSDPEIYRRLAALERWRDDMASVERPAVPEDWIAPTLINSWVNFGGLQAPAGYYKDAWGRVHLRGLVKDGITIYGTTIFVLPAGYRPAFIEYHGTASNDAFGEIFIEANGNVDFAIGSNVWIALNGISFRAA